MGIYVLAVLGAGLLWAIRRGHAALAPASGMAAFWRQLLDNARDTATPIVVVTWAFAVFSFVLGQAWRAGGVEVGALVRAEAWLGELGPIAAALKVPKLAVVAFLLVVFLGSLFAMPGGILHRARGRLHGVLDASLRVLSVVQPYNRFLSTTAGFLAAIGLFTFFGPNAGPPETRLEARLKGLNDEIGAFAGDLEERIRFDLANELVHRAIGAPLRKALAEYVKARRAFASTVGSAAGRPLVPDPTSTSRDLRAAVALLSLAPEADRIGNARVSAREQPSLALDVVGNLSLNDLKEMRPILDAARADLSAYPLLAVEAGRRVIGMMLPLILDAEAVIDPRAMGEIDPLLRPAAEIAVTTLNDQVKGAANKAVDHVRDRVLRGEIRSVGQRRDAAAEAAKSIHLGSPRAAALHIADEIEKASTTIEQAERQLAERLEIESSLRETRLAPVDEWLRRRRPVTPNPHRYRPPPRP